MSASLEKNVIPRLDQDMISAIKAAKHELGHGSQQEQVIATYTEPGYGYIPRIEIIY